MTSVHTDFANGSVFQNSFLRLPSLFSNGHSYWSANPVTPIRSIHEVISHGGTEMHENEVGVRFICIKTSIFCANLLTIFCGCTSSGWAMSNWKVRSSPGLRPGIAQGLHGIPRDCTELPANVMLALLLSPGRAGG